MPTYVDHARYRDQVFTRRKFDLTLNIWSFEEVEDVYPLFHSKGVMNFIGYNNADVDTLLDTAKATKDYKKYKEMMKQLHALLAQEDLPYFFLWSLDIYSGISKKEERLYPALLLLHVLRGVGAAPLMRTEGAKTAVKSSTSLGGVPRCVAASTWAIERVGRAP
jgi:ABC-type transport system substrate-binding protein